MVNALRYGSALLLTFFTSFLQAYEVRVEFSGLRREQTAAAAPRFTAFKAEPFTMKVIVSGAQTKPPVDIDGLRNFRVTGPSVSTRMQMINGQFSSEFMHIYELEALQEGTYSVGPINVEGKAATPAYEIVVRSRTPTDSPAGGEDEASAQRAGECFAQLTLSQTTAVVDEPVVLSVHLYERGSVFTPQIEQFPSTGLIVKEGPHDISRTENIQGKEYRVRELQFLIFPQQAGVIQIPPLRVQYRLPTTAAHRQRDFFGDVFDAFMGPQLKQITSRTNSLTLTVTPLPPHQGAVDGVGNFTRFEAQFEKSDLVLNEPVRMTLTLEGLGSFDHIATPKLTLPEGCRAYESKNEVHHDLSQGIVPGSKQFEFVLQVGKAGRITIPAQSFTYFDPSHHSYRTLVTTPQELTVVAPVGAIASAVTQTPPATSTKEPAPPEPPPTGTDIHFIEEEAPVQETGKTNVPFALFILLLFMPAIFIAPRIWKKYKQESSWSRRKKFSKVQLSGALQNAIERQDGAAACRVFIGFFAHVNKESEHLITHDWIEATLRVQQWQDEEIVRFLAYLDECAGMAYTTTKKDAVARKILLHQGEKWLECLIATQGAKS